MKKFFLGIFIAAGVISSASSLDIVLRGNPGIMFPSNTDYSTGFNGNVQLDADLFGFLTAGVEVNLSSSNIDSLNQNIMNYGGGLGLGAYWFPFSRLYLGAGGAFGVYQFNSKIDDENINWSDLYWRGYGELGLRFSPSFTLTGSGGYISYLVNNSDPLMNAPFAAIGFRYSIPVGKKGSAAFVTSSSQDDSALPVFMNAYRTCPLGNISIRNNQGAEVRNVHISFRAGKYTASTYESASIPLIKKYGVIEVPLYSDFSAEILRFSENGKISGEIVIDYEFLGKKLQAVQNAVISVYNRNAFVWSDSTGLATFISPETPEIMEFAKYVAGIARNNFYTGMNRNLQMAAAMTEALRISGIRYNQDKTTPYKDFHSTDKVDYIQYPLQTMNLSGGDYDDMGILLASCLESVGVPTGYLPLDDDFIVLVGSGVRPGAEGNSFGNVSGLIVDEENVFFGISMKNLEKGFSVARNSASKSIAAALSSEEGNYEYTNVHAAWEVYIPCAFSENGAYFEKPGSGAITKSFTAAVQDYMNTDLAEVLTHARKSGDSNKIGAVLLRLGRYSEAKAEFNKLNTASALNNLATVYMIEKNYSAAASTYKRVLAKDPSNRIALKGLDNANAKLGL